MSLREELGRIPGVVDADVDLRDGRPTAIRIHSSDGADRRAIGEAVQHALRRHGLRSRVAPPRRDPEPAAAPAPPHLSLMSDVGVGSSRPSPQRISTRSARRLTSVGARDDGERTFVTVADDRGGSAEAGGGRHRQGQIAACVRAVAELFEASGQIPEVISVRRWEHDQRRFVTVVIDVEGHVRVGSAVDDGLELRAIALAVWQALNS